MSEWNRTAPLLMVLINAHKGKGRPIKYEECHPYLTKGPGKVGIKVTRGNISILKAFVGDRHGDRRN